MSSGSKESSGYGYIVKTESGKGTQSILGWGGQLDGWQCGLTPCAMY